MIRIRKKLSDLQILQKLVSGLKTLEPHQFRFQSFVSSHIVDEKNNICNTVCCAWGWVHKFVPEINVKFIIDNWDCLIINKRPYQILNLNEEIINFMFYGNDLQMEKYDNTHSVDSLLFGSTFLRSLKLSEVINRIEYVINNIK